MSEKPDQPKQSMNEILASIRAIIGDGDSASGKGKQTTASIAEALAEDDPAPTRHAPRPSGPKPHRVGALTVEELAAELMRPMLQRWMDENLHDIVKDLVAGEVKRKVGR